MNTLVINKEDLRHNINKIKEYAKKSGQDDAGKDVISYEYPLLGYHSL